MKMNQLLVMGVGLALAACAPLGGCGEKQNAKPPAKGDDHGHDHGSGGHTHTADEKSGEQLSLGEQTIGAFKVKATRMAGAIAPGKDAPVDIIVTGGGAKAVRIWIGTQDAKGSVKAKAEVEDAKAGHWHTHAEAPSPMPAGSKLWVEVEDEKGASSVGSFDLKN